MPLLNTCRLLPETRLFRVWLNQPELPCSVSPFAARWVQSRTPDALKTRVVVFIVDLVLAFTIGALIATVLNLCHLP